MSGERKDGRDHIDRTAKHLVEKGGLPPSLAYERAKQARIRAEKREGRGDK